MATNKYHKLWKAFTVGNAETSMYRRGKLYTKNLENKSSNTLELPISDRLEEVYGLVNNSIEKIRHQFHTRAAKLKAKNLPRFKP